MEDTKDVISMDVAPYNIVKIIEGLRAVRDHGTNLQGELQGSTNC